MKKWWKSKTVWIGGLQLISTLALIAVELLQKQTISADPTQIILMLNGTAMLFLRWVTDKPISSPVAAMDSLRPRIAKNEKAKRYIVR